MPLFFHDKMFVLFFAVFLACLTIFKREHHLTTVDNRN